MRFNLFVSIASTVVLGACNAVPMETTARSPEAFKTVETARFRPADQLHLMDCVYDGFQSSQAYGFATSVRQTKRADGYRIDVGWTHTQYLVADLKDDGTYRLSIWVNHAQIPLSNELAAASACIKKFGIPA